MVKVNHDLTKVLKPKYHGKWVVLNSEQTKVLIANRSPKKALDEAEKKGYKNGVIMYALNDYRGLVS